MTAKLESAIVGAITLGAILMVGAAHTQGWVDRDTTVLANGFILGGGLGWVAKTNTSNTPPGPIA